MSHARGASVRDYLDRPGSLAVLRNAGHTTELFLLVGQEGVTAFNGHVDLGTGVATALSQIVAEELDVPMGEVTMVLGHTQLAPDQGPTIASETIQVAAMPLRQAAAQARHFLLGLAAEALGAPQADLRIENGVIIAGQAGNRRVRFATLLEGRQHRLELDPTAQVKASSTYRIVGQAVPRTDIPAKADGSFTYVHDLRLPGMLHGSVVRPPYAGLDAGDFVGTSLIAVHGESIAHVPGVVAVVVIGDFVGVVAEREEQAAQAAQDLQIAWKPGPRLPDMAELATTLTAQPGHARTLLDTGGVSARAAAAEPRLTRTYTWPYQMHGSIGPSCAVADARAQGITVWSGTQNPLKLRQDLATLLALPEPAIEILRLEAAGCYGRNCADDVAADAALLSRAVGRPVRVQLTRAQEHLWEPKGAAQVMHVDGGLTPDGAIAAYDFATRYPSNAAPTLALLLTGAIPPVPDISTMGDRTAIPPYRFDHMRVVVHDVAPIVRASWLRGVSALPNSFAHECYIDELAAEAGADPVAFRLRHLEDPRGSELIRQVAARAGWVPRAGARRHSVRPGVMSGQGIAYARYMHGPFPGTAAAWSAWVAEVEVDTGTGAVSVTRVVVGQDSGLVINPAGVTHQIHGNVIQSVSRVLKEEVRFSDQAVASREWGAYPILTFPEVPQIQVVMVPRPDDPPLGAGESASVPSAAAIANAIFDATGLRLRAPPFTEARVLAALRQAEAGGQAPAARAPAWKRWPGAMASVIIALAAGFSWHAAIAPVPPPDAGLYSSAAIARGRILAAVGNCAVCHTQEGGAPNAGGRGIATPFGIVVATNITPDVQTGIGAWSFAAFARAMRQGVHRDGRLLYPAFPYTSYAKATEDDLQALYAYLMSQPPVRARVPPTRLAFPFSVRPLLAGWNALFLRGTAFQPDPAQTPQWNRGAYLVEGFGHCGACHSPRNLLGAERGGAHHLAGGVAGGWDAPALASRSEAPVPWTEDEMFAYLRHGASAQHGVAAGPMGPVVASLADVPDEDIRAMAHYLASLAPPITQAAAQARADGLEAQALARGDHHAGAALYAGACAACHDRAGVPVFGAGPSLALNTNLHAARPDNLLRVVLGGVHAPGAAARGVMPPFRNSLDDRQLADLLAYLRTRFAAGQPPWPNLMETARRLRQTSSRG
jgi:nicotinate dehydrogenase subunit B